ncbi:MAG: ATP-dependent DNA ligase [Candidatus Thorarchaeota archaeon]
MFIKPMKAKKDNCKGVPFGGYLYETKWDGIRALIVYIRGKQPVIYSKNGADITYKFPEVFNRHTVAETLCCNSAMIDCELVCLKDGVPSFSAITSRFHSKEHSKIRQGIIDNPVTVMAFDILEINGEDVMSETLNYRKELLSGCMTDGQVYRVSRIYRDGEKLYEREKAKGAEGIIAKAAKSTYQPGRRLRDWLKVKIMYKEEVIVYGFIDGKGKRVGQFGSLLFQGLDGRPAGKVGTGFTDQELIAMTLFLDARGAVETKPGTYVLDRPFHAIVEGMKKNRSGAIREPVYVGTVFNDFGEVVSS